MHKECDIKRKAWISCCNWASSDRADSGEEDGAGMSDMMNVCAENDAFSYRSSGEEM